MLTNGRLMGVRNPGGNGVWSLDDSMDQGVLLPITEATADDNTFVCEMTGGSSSNETGVGGGLSGADLVLTQVGSVPAASGGWRTISSTAQGFTCAAALAALLTLPEWTLLIRYRNRTLAAAMRSLFSFTFASGFVDAGDYGSLADPFSYVYPRQYAYTPIVGRMPDSSDGCIACWRKSGVLHFGVKTTAGIPTGWGSFEAANRVAIYTAQCSGAASSARIVGYAGSSMLMDVGTVVVSKIGLAAAPM